MEKPGPIGVKELSEIFRSKSFDRLLRESALHTFNTGYESGFLVKRNLQDRFLYSEVAVGGTEYLEQETIDEDYLNPRRSYGVLNLHFHPSAEGYVCPSDMDIGYFNSLRERAGVNCKPIGGVAQIDFDKNIDMLLLQEKTDRPLTEALLSDSYSTIDELRDRGYPSTEEIAKGYRKTGLYEAANLKFELTSAGVLIPDSELDKLQDFAYQPSLREMVTEYT